MKCCSLLCALFCCTLTLSGASQAAGIEAAANAEELIEACRDKNFIVVPACMNYSLNRKWKHELEYAGKEFSAIGRFDEVKESLIGNLFAFLTVDEYRVACKITKRHAGVLNELGSHRRVFISGVIESYKISFNLHTFHHLRLTPYCSIEAIL